MGISPSNCIAITLYPLLCLFLLYKQEAIHPMTTPTKAAPSSPVNTSYAPQVLILIIISLLEFIAVGCVLLSHVLLSHVVLLVIITVLVLHSVSRVVLT